MSFVRTYPEHLAAAASNLQSLGAALNVGSAAAAAPVTGVVPATLASNGNLYAATEATNAASAG
jgi:PE family